MRLPDPSKPVAWRATDGRGRPELFHYDPTKLYPHLGNVQPLWLNAVLTLNQNALTLPLLVELGKTAERVLAAQQRLKTHMDLRGELQAEVRQQEDELNDMLYALNEQLGLS